MVKLLKSLFNRVVIVSALIIIQLIILIMTIWNFSTNSIYVYANITILCSTAAVLWIINNKDNPAYKLAWIIPILVFPAFGGPFYLLFGMKRLSRRVKRTMIRSYRKTQALLQQNSQLVKEIEQQDKSISRQVEYVYTASNFPVYAHTTSSYLPTGEIKFEVLKQELERAEHYIFLEYFIIQEGIMWDSLLEIMVRKAEQGVDVRVIYDDFGCLKTLPYQYNKQLEALGIKCQVFNPLLPLLSLRMNNRDHRKIVVIDGHTAFTGGVNLADEYINAYPRFGHWKDSSIMIKGEAVWNFTVMFLANWDYLAYSDEDYEQFRPHVHHQESFHNDGYVMPYGDSPLDNETVGASTYLNMINRAKDYIYINTPYLIVDNETVTALCLAAKSGIDVRIVTPHIPDKWYVHMVTRAYYQQLIESGIKIYEYTPGFMHSKTFAVDDELAIVGTINLDYRSLYLHFECAVWIYQSKTVMDVKDDFLTTLKLCQQISLEDCYQVKWYTRLARSVMRIFAPLM